MDLKTAFGSEQTFTVTNLHSKASSATAGWSGAAVDNTSNLYPDALVQFVFAAVNTAPGSDAKIYIFGYGYSNSGDPCTTGATSGGTVGTEGNLTFPTISSAVQILPYKSIPYVAQNTAIKTPEISMCDLLQVSYGCLPPYWGVAVLNFAGFTLASSGNTGKWRGVYATGA